MKAAPVLLVALIVCAGCGSVESATPVMDYRWEPVPSAQPGGILGERLGLWREHRLWRVSDEPFLLEGFESPPGKHAWQGEHVGKWLHAATLTYEATQEPRLGEQLDQTVQRLLAAQQEDGYLGTYEPDKRFHAPPGDHTKVSWDIWTHRYVLYGLLTYERFHPAPAVIEACLRIGDLLIATFGRGRQDLTATGTRRGLSSATVLESVMMLYARTGEPRFLDFAEHLHRSIERNEGLRVVSHLSAGGDAEVPGDGKAYQLMAVLLGYAEMYRFTGEATYLDAVVNGWNNIRAHHTYATGGPWSYKSDEIKNQECFARPEFFDPTNFVETCSTVTWIQLSLELLRLTGEARYAAEAERAAFNHLLGAQGPNGLDWAYFTPANCPRRKYEDVVNCCASSGPRALEMYARHLIGFDGEVLTLNTYVPLSAELHDPEERLRGIEMSGEYPLGGAISLVLDLSAPAEFPVDFVVLDGTKGIRVLVGGQPQELEPTPTGHQRLKRTWRPGEEVSVELDFALTAHHQNGRDGHRWIAFKYGPLALAENVKTGNEDLDPLSPKGRAADAFNWLEATPGDQGRPAYRIRGAEVVLLPYYLAGSTGDGVRTFFPVSTP